VSVSCVVVSHCNPLLHRLPRRTPPPERPSPRPIPVNCSQYWPSNLRIVLGMLSVKRVLQFFHIQLPHSQPLEHSPSNLVPHDEDDPQRSHGVFPGGLPPTRGMLHTLSLLQIASRPYYQTRNPPSLRDRTFDGPVVLVSFFPSSLVSDTSVRTVPSAPSFLPYFYLLSFGFVYIDINLYARRRRAHYVSRAQITRKSTYPL